MAKFNIKAEKRGEPGNMVAFEGVSLTVRASDYDEVTKALTPFEAPNVVIRITTYEGPINGLTLEELKKEGLFAFG